MTIEQKMLMQTAIGIVKLHHMGQKDLAGRPYIDHVMRVARRVAKQGADAMIVALLHDILEDSKVTQAELKILFPAEIVEAVSSLTHLKGERYKDYIKNIAQNPLAKVVKIADLEDNMDMGRLKKVRQVDTDRQRKYVKAIEYLKGLK